MSTLFDAISDGGKDAAKGTAGDIILTSMYGIRLLWGAVTGVICLLVVLALTSVSASSPNISHAYNSSEEIVSGSLVSLDEEQTDFVEVANTSNSQRLIGVAVVSDDSLLAVDAEVSKIQVATQGVANVLVSTLNGPIKVGDQIAVSPFDGVGMKASPGSRIIGLAETAFDSDSEGASTQSVTDKDGRRKEVQVGLVSVSIGVGTSSTQGEDSQLNGLQQLTKSVTGRTVSTWRAVVSLVVAVVALAALVTLIYASIYGSIISIGRNPLAKYAVFRTLGSVLGLALLTAGLAGLTIYFLIR